MQTSNNPSFPVSKLFFTIEFVHRLSTPLFLMHINLEHLTLIIPPRRHRCDRTLTWNSGALHYSDEVILVRELSDLATDRAALKSNINGIEYIGKGTYTDCAIKRGLAELLIGYPSHTHMHTIL